MRRHGVVHCVGEEEVWLARLDTQLEDFLPELACVHSLDDFAGLRREKLELAIVTDSFHEGVCDVQAVVQVERFTVEVTGSLTDFEEFLDFRVVDVQIARRRTATQRALADCQCQGVHHADEWDNAGGLTVLTDFFADRTYAAPICADAAAIGCEPDILIPCLNNAIEGVIDSVQEAGDWQTAVRATVRKDWCRRHEPELRDIVINALCVVSIISVSCRNARKHALKAFARQEVTIFEGFLTKFSQIRVT